MRRWRVEKILNVIFFTERLLGYGIGILYARQQSTKQFHRFLHRSTVCRRWLNRGSVHVQ